MAIACCWSKCPFFCVHPAESTVGARRQYAKPCPGAVSLHFFVAVTVRFDILLYIVGDGDRSRRMVRVSITENPTAEWTIQQLREAIPSDHSYRLLIHDRYATFSHDLDAAVRNLGISVLKTPVRSTKANAFCERLIGTVRRECLDQ